MAEASSEERIRENVALAPLTYYRIGGPARYYAQPESLEDLAGVFRVLREKGIGYFILGAGSNVLFDDQGFDGLVIHTSKLDRNLRQTVDEIEVGASVMNAQVLRQCMKTGLSGFEFLAGVPGNIGGALFMNAGTKLGDMNSVVESITVYDLKAGRKRTLSRAEIKYGYRSQLFLGANEIIVRAKMKGRPADPKAVQERVKQLLESRRKTQPIDKPSCGSVFKNPGNAAAWKLIEEVGLRGYRVGNAQFSPLHCNFIVNLGGAKASDVKALIAEAKSRVRSRLNLELEEEVRIVPFRSVPG